ncbi:MAG: hypothetical protein ACRD50_09770 [Candidatus Acidiferrales bacterium]
MRVAFVKQALDVFGPWRTLRWQDTTPRELFEVWPGKATYWEMTCCLEADWYIVPQQIVTGYTHDAILKHPGRPALTQKYTEKIVDPEEIPFGDYDLVVSFDPVLAPRQGSSTLFAYFAHEHWDAIYRKSLHMPVRNYDLFLAHMMDATIKLTALPQAVSFPYLRAPELARSIFSVEKEEIAWVEWRTVAALGMSEVWNESSEAAQKRLGQALGVPTRTNGSFNLNPYGISDPPSWGDGAAYLTRLAGCRYFIAATAAGAGQSLCDAASLGCITIGVSELVYHRMLCHPECLCEDLEELPKKFRRVAASHDLQREVLHWQDQKLREHFIESPLALLRTAVEKKSGLAQRPDMHLAHA